MLEDFHVNVLKCCFQLTIAVIRIFNYIVALRVFIIFLPFDPFLIKM